MDKKTPLQTINGINCLTKCHEKGKEYVNPVTLDKLQKINNATCAIIPIPSVDGDYKMGGVCKLEDNETHRIPDERDSMLLTFYFSPNDFLSEIYDLHTFTQVINWTIENHYYHFETIKRVHNAAWKSYGHNMENISDSVIDFYYTIAINNWIHDYKENILSKYSFDILSSNKMIGNASPDKIDTFIILNFINKAYFVQIIKKYIETYKDQWTTIDSHYRNFKNFVYKCIIKNMKYKLNNKNNSNDINLFSK